MKRERPIWRGWKKRCPVVSWLEVEMSEIMLGIMNDFGWDEVDMCIDDITQVSHINLNAIERGVPFSI